MAVTFDQSEASCAIRLEGEINITAAAELKKVLLQALAPGKEMRVDLERATELDVTALKLLWALEREAPGRFFLTGRAPEEIVSAAMDAGFEKFPVPPYPS